MLVSCSRLFPGHPVYDVVYLVEDEAWLSKPAPELFWAVAWASGAVVLDHVCYTCVVWGFLV